MLLTKLRVERPQEWLKNNFKITQNKKKSLIDFGFLGGAPLEGKFFFGKFD
jgi:hypothetical protein